MCLNTILWALQTILLTYTYNTFMTKYIFTLVTQFVRSTSLSGSHWSCVLCGWLLFLCMSLKNFYCVQLSYSFIFLIQLHNYSERKKNLHQRKFNPTQLHVHRSKKEYMWLEESLVNAFQIPNIGHPARRPWLCE